MVKLDEILEKSLQLRASLEQLSLHPDLVPLQLDIGQLRKCCRDLHQENEGEHTKAHYLLANSSVNAENSNKLLNGLQLRDAPQSLVENENDLEAFVRQNREKDILSVITHRKRQAEVDFQNYFNEHMITTWQERKRNITKNLGLEKSVAYETSSSSRLTHDLAKQSVEDYTQNHLRKSQLNPYDDISLPKNDQESWSPSAQTFSQAVKSLNEHRQLKQPVAICSLMCQLVRSLGSESRDHQLADSWHMLAFIVNEKHIEYNGEAVGDLFHARHYSSRYCFPNGNDASIKNLVINGSRRYLETQFFSLLERVIVRNPQEARLGGTPTAENKIKAFVNVRFSKHGRWTVANLEIINNCPMWAILFYLIRSGFLQEAVQYSNKNESALSKVEKNWCSYIRAYAASPDRRLPRQLADRLNSEYNSRVKFVSETTDPFKHALFKILGRCELSRRMLPEVLPVVEDWMWLQLVLAREIDRDDAIYEDFSLKQLQQNLLSFGPRHFNAKGGNALLYFQILLLSGQFERAIHYLASESWVDAVHFAIVLSYYGLLRISSESNPTALLQCPLPEEVPRLDFTGMMRRYGANVQKFNSFAAVEYLSLICLNSDLPEFRDQQREACYSSLHTLVSETRDYAALLGDVRNDGTREPGFIERRLGLLGLQDEKQYLRAIVEHAAATSDQEGRLSDAVLLYHLSEEYDTVVQIINRSLGEALLDPTYRCTEVDLQSSSLTRSEDPAILARNMQDLYSTNATLLSSVSQANKDNCKTLLSIVECKKYHDSGQYDSCLSTIDHIGILPLSDNVTTNYVKGRSQAFALLEDCVARVVPLLLLTASRCLRKKFEVVTASTYQDQTRQAQVTSIKRKARNLSTFAGLIRYQMNDDTRLAMEELLIAIR